MSALPPKAEIYEVHRMAEQLQGKIAIVTGASNGIGRGIAELFAAEGAKTVLVARRGELLDEVAAGIKAKGGEALPVPADLTKEDAIITLFKKTVETFGRLDVLVNNAGIAPTRTPRTSRSTTGTRRSPSTSPRRFSARARRSAS